MKYSVLCFGKSKFSFVDDGVKHYLKAIGHFTDVELVELKDSAAHSEQEEKTLREYLKKKRLSGEGKSRVLLLDENGAMQGSVKFAQSLQKFADQGTGHIVFVIGGAYGFTSALRAEYSMLSLSPMTFPHDLVRVFLLEQIYRALHIQTGGKYHHS